MNFGLANTFQYGSRGLGNFNSGLIERYYQQLGQKVTQEQVLDILQNPQADAISITKAWRVFFPHESEKISTFTKFGECHVKQNTHFNENRTSLEVSFYSPVQLHENAVLGLVAVIMDHMREKTIHELSLYHCFFTDYSWTKLLESLQQLQPYGMSELTLRINQSNLNSTQLVKLNKFNCTNGLILIDKNLDEIISALSFKMFLESSPLKTFGVVTEELTEERLNNICEPLLKNKSLKHLFFKDNIHVKNIASIVNLVKDHLTIESLSLEGKGITEEALQILAEGLKRRGKNISIRIADSEIDSRVISAFIRTLGPVLYQLDLSGLPLKDLDIILAAYPLENITHLSLDNTYVSEEMVIGLTQKFVELKVDQIRKSIFQLGLTAEKVEELAKEGLDSLIDGIYKLKLKENNLKSEDQYMNLLKKIQSSSLSQELLDEVLSFEGLRESSDLIEHLLSKKFEVIHVDPLGDCLFIALQIISENLCQNGRMMRKELVNWIRAHPLDFQYFLPESFESQSMDLKLNQYCDKMEQYYDPSKGINGTWGGELELRAMADYLVGKGLNQHIRVIDPSYELKVVNGEFETTLIYGNPKTEPLYIARVHQNHYIALKKLKEL